MSPELLPSPVDVARTGDAVDGRRLRGERNKEGVIEAILDLLREGNERPTTAEIAERSGVSVRSVFRHFDDVESLYAAAVDAHAQRIAPLHDQPLPEGDLAHRIEAVVAWRVAIYEDTGAVRRVAERLRGSSPSIAGRLEYGRNLHRASLDAVFAPEIAKVPPRRRQVLADALETASGWHAWEALRVQGATRERAIAVMEQTLRALLQTS